MGIMLSFTDRLNIKKASEYNYLKQSDCLVIDGTDDAKDFHTLRVTAKIIRFYCHNLWAIPLR